MVLLCRSRVAFLPVLKLCSYDNKYKTGEIEKLLLPEPLRGKGVKREETEMVKGAWADSLFKEIVSYLYIRIYKYIVHSPSSFEWRNRTQIRQAASLACSHSTLDSQRLRWQLVGAAQKLEELALE